MNGTRKLGSLGVAITVLIASVLLSATPARADGIVRYENVGNPGWCMAAVQGVRLAPCGSNYHQQWLWNVVPTGPMAGMIMLSRSDYPREHCLAYDASWNEAYLAYCNVNAANQYWSVWGQNGWVVYQLANTNSCLMPYGTDAVRSTYPLALSLCPARTNVPNIYAWRY
ncbi:hypothetical protein ACWGE0_26075 [Lentzea sp. NPDC054927]